MNIHMSKRLFVVAAVLGALAVFAAAFFVALGVRAVVAGPDSGPAAAPPNPGHSWSDIGDLPGTVWHSNNDGPGSALDADTVDGLQSGEIHDADDYVSNAGYCSSAGDADTVDGTHASTLEESGEIDTDIATHATDASAHHTKTTDASEIVSGTMAPERISGTGWTSLNDGAESGLDADTLDGVQASELGGGGCYTNWNGDTCAAGYTAVETGVWTAIGWDTGGIICAAEKAQDNPNYASVQVATRWHVATHNLHLEPCAICCK